MHRPFKNKWINVEDVTAIIKWHIIKEQSIMPGCCKEELRGIIQQIMDSPLYIEIEREE